MLDRLVGRVRWLSANPGAADAVINSAEQRLGCCFPADYRQFLRIMDGGESRTSSEENLCLFGTHELPEINAAAATDELLPGWFIIGSDLGGKSYLMRRWGKDNRVVSCFDESFGEETLAMEAESFEAFLEKLFV